MPVIKQRVVADKGDHPCRISSLMLCLLLLLLASCAQSPGVTNGSATPTATRPTVLPALSPSPATSVTPAAPTSTPDTTPTRFTMHTLLSGVGRPDDLVFDPQGRLVFSDFYNGTVSRVNADGSVTTIASGLAGPEGLAYFPDGTLIIAEQRTNRLLKLSPGSAGSTASMSPTVLRVLPGVPSNQPCKDGMDGLAFDPTTSTLIVLDSPAGNVYRISLDGNRVILLASGFVRPVGAAVDALGNIYVADECGGAVWRIAQSGSTHTLTRMGGFGMPDDVAFDSQGNMLVIDLQPAIHALIRVRRATGVREVLASKGFIEPQGLVIDARGTIYVSDDYANTIVEFIPA